MKKNLELKIFSAFYLIYFAALGSFMPFINQYLLVNIGLSGKQLGTFTFITLILSVFIAPLWGIFGDKAKKYKLLLLISIGGSIIAAFNYSLRTGYLAVCISGIILEICRSGSIPMSDVQTINYTTKNNKNFGSIRSMGSLGFVLGSLAVGRFIQGNNYSPIFTIYIVLLFLAFLIAFGFPKTEIKNSSKQIKEKGKSNFKEVLSNKKFLFIAMVSLMTSVLMNSANGFVANFITTELSGPANSASMFTLVTALPEILLLSIIGKLFLKYGYKKIYMLNAFVLIIRYLVYAFTSSYILILLISLVHCITVACSAVGNLSYLKHSVNENSYATAVTLNTATISIGNGIYSLIFGNMLDLFGSRSIFMATAVIMVFGLIFISKSKYFNDIDNEIMLK